MSRRNPRDKQTGSIFKPGPHSLPDLKPSGKRPAPAPLPCSEAQLERQLRDLFSRQRHLPIKTEAGSKWSGAQLPSGWPDITALLPLPGLPYALVALVEVKTATGKLRPSQVTQHAARRLCGLEPHVIRTLEDAQALIDAGLKLQRQILAAAK